MNHLSYLKKYLFIGVLTVFIVIIVVLITDYYLKRSVSNLLNLKESSLEESQFSQEPILPLKHNYTGIDSAKIELGKALFSDSGISNNGKSCETCHDINRSGKHPDEKWVLGGSSSYNTPSIFNTSFNFRQFWNGRAVTIEEQLKLNFSSGLKISIEESIQKISRIEHYKNRFKKSYEDGITVENVLDALVYYQKHLQSPSKFDSYLLGDESALTQVEKEGYILFKQYGCSSCHQGINIGGNMFQKFGIIKQYFEEESEVKKIDLGRFNLTNKPSDKFVFKVPSLRNVALTGPYLHDGSVKTLEEVVLIMSKYQLGREIPDEDAAKIVAFLKSLTGTCFKN